MRTPVTWSPCPIPQLTYSLFGRVPFTWVEPLNPWVEPWCESCTACRQFWWKCASSSGNKGGRQHLSFLGPRPFDWSTVSQVHEFMIFVPTLGVSRFFSFIMGRDLKEDHFWLLSVWEACREVKISNYLNIPRFHSNWHSNMLFWRCFLLFSTGDSTGRRNVQVKRLCSWIKITIWAKKL